MKTNYIFSFVHFLEERNQKVVVERKSWKYFPFFMLKENNFCCWRKKSLNGLRMEMKRRGWKWMFDECSHHRKGKQICRFSQPLCKRLIDKLFRKQSIFLRTRITIYDGSFFPFCGKVSQIFSLNILCEIKRSRIIERLTILYFLFTKQTLKFSYNMNNDMLNNAMSGRFR